MYRGRFAPTISGPLHFGSLITAVASYLDAKAHGGQWLLHIDDLDQPRVPPQAESQILTTLEAHGLYWDGKPLRQTDQIPLYQHYLEQLRAQDLLFYCTCSRSQRPFGKPYPGTCRGTLNEPKEPSAIRILTDDVRMSFVDRVQGPFSRSIAEVDGDFLVYRKDKMAAYPLSAVIDDASTQITHVVRGADLLANTLNQIYLIENLGLTTPEYAHVAVLNERDGKKLSKRNQSVAVDDTHAQNNLNIALQLLGMSPPSKYSIEDLLVWATKHWDIRKLPNSSHLETFFAI